MATGGYWATLESYEVHFATLRWFSNLVGRQHHSTLLDGISTMIETCNQNPEMHSEGGRNEAVAGGFWVDESWLKIPYFVLYCFAWLPKIKACPERSWSWFNRSSYTIIKLGSHMASRQAACKAAFCHSTGIPYWDPFGMVHWAYAKAGSTWMRLLL